MMRLARSMLVGGAATLVDLTALTAMVTLLGVSPRVASVPALLLAAVVQFTGQRHFAFRAGRGHARRQVAYFACVHAVTLLLNAVVFDVTFRLVGSHVPYWALRLVVGNAVYLTWSFPMFRRVFAEASVRPSRP